MEKYREYARLRGAGDDAGGVSQGSPRSVGALVSTSSWQTGTQTTDSAVAHTAATDGGAAAAWQGAGDGRGVKRTGAADAPPQQQQQPTRSSRRRSSSPRERRAVQARARTAGPALGSPC